MLVSADMNGCRDQFYFRRRQLAAEVDPTDLVIRQVCIKESSNCEKNLLYTKPGQPVMILLDK